jgi:hypothetical protein
MEFIHDDKAVQEHILRLHTACFGTYNLQDVVRYIEEKTYLNGDLYSFKDHEYQKDIISDTHVNVNVQKCAQVGMSEVMARYALAICRVIPYFDCILTMPGAQDCAKFFQTRIDPVINDSPDLAEVVRQEINNTQTKDIGGNLLHGRGTRGTTQALSVPADMLIHDEVDRSDPFTLKQYQSRLKHSIWQFTRKFGTPTFNGVGIAAAMEESKRKRHLVKCDKCNHHFAPTYHEHVVIPGYDKPKNEISAHNLMTIRYKEAYVCCPHCGRAPSLQFEHREWVFENPNDQLNAHGYYVTPFSVPNIVPVHRIVEESTKFPWGEFCNQTLGETSSETSETLTREDIEQCKYTAGGLLSSDLHAMGVDLGAVCHITIGRRTNEGMLIVVHRERVALPMLRERSAKLKQEYRVLTSVWDHQPYTDLILDLQKDDLNMYAGRYNTTRNVALFDIVTREQNEAEGKLPLLIAKLNRDVGFDELMKLFKTKQVLWQAQSEQEDTLFVNQMLDMKRTLVQDAFGDGRYTWVKKPNDEDHYHHALGYLNIATLLMPTASIQFPLTNISIAHRIKVATRKETMVYGSMR